MEVIEETNCIFFKQLLPAVQISGYAFDAVAVGYLAAFEKPAATACLTATNTALQSGNNFCCHLYCTLLLLSLCDWLEKNVICTISK